MDTNFGEVILTRMNADGRGCSNREDRGIREGIFSNAELSRSRQHAWACNNSHFYPPTGVRLEALQIRRA